MNRLWLREYEILLSSNRRDDRVKKPVRSKVLSRPQTATSSRKVKQKKIIPAEELRNENELATELLAIATKGEYRRSAPELSERKFGTKKYSPSPNTTSPFRGLQTLEQFEEVERKKELYLQTHDVELFREIFPPVTNTNFRPTDRPRTSHGRRRGGGGGGGKDIVSRYDGLITPGSKEGNGDSIRRKSSPSRLNHATNVVQALLKSTNDQDRITAEDLQIDVTPIDKEIAQQAEGIWEQLVTEIWTCGQSILYNELTSFATSWQKSPTSRSIVRYLCALFGLKTHTSHLLVLAAERSLFRELLPLLKYLREINPLTVPRKRLLKARTIYDKYFVPLQEEHSLQVTDSESYLHITPLEQKFFRWVQAFHQVLLIILHASVHQTLLENDTIDYAEETLEALQRKDRQQSTHPTDAAVSANNKYLTVKKKKIPSNLATTHHQHPQQMMESSISSSATPSLAMLSLTGVLPVDEILPNDEKPHKVKMRSIEEEHGHPSPHPASHRSPRIVDLPECNPLTEPVTDPGGVPGEEDKIGVALFSNDYDTS